MGRQLGGLRGIAILLVVLNHTIIIGANRIDALGYPGANDWRATFLLTLDELGHFAVPVFLFISGSFIAYAAGGKSKTISWKSLQSMLKRLLWPYLLWSVLFFIYTALRNGYMEPFLLYAKHLVVGYPYHFIPILIFYYALSPILVPLARKYSYWLILVIALCQLIMSNIQTPGLLGFTFPGWMRIFAPPVLANTFTIWGVYFPMGLVFSLHAKEFNPKLYKIRWVSLIVTIALFIAGTSPADAPYHFFLARYIYPITFMLLIPVIKRQWIPWVRHFEYVGKHSYGLYLAHMIMVDLAYWLIQLIVPGLYNYPILLRVPVFVTAVAIPLILMEISTKLPTRNVYRYVFG
ncbi:MAG: acyltransferase [Ardenticatenaceae bacterium]|nr:acyltransferase [Ardenticatenaceae bacterium]